MRYRKEIDGFRGLSILLVLLSHAKLWPVGGFVGVDVFFVLSGYLVGLRQKEKVKANQFRIKEYWIARWRRLVPAHLVMVAFCSIVAVLLMMPYDLDDFKNTLISNFLLNSNNYFSCNNNYFDMTSEEVPLLHTWSLAIEEQFFLISSFFIAKWERFRKFFFLARFFSFICSFLIPIFYKDFGYFSSLSRFYEIGSGFILGFIYNSRIISKFYYEVICFLCLTTILILSFVINQSFYIPGIWSFIIVLSILTLLHLDCFEKQDTFFFNIIANRYLIFIGLISYSVYLFHWPIFSFFKYFSDSGLKWYLRIILVFLSIIIAYLTTKLIENPIRKFEICKNNRSLAIFSFVGLAFIFFINTFPTWVSAKFSLNFGKAAECKFYFKDTRFSSNAIEKIQNGKDADGVLFWGDSHVMHFVPGVLSNSIFKNKNIYIATSGGIRPTILKSSKSELAHAVHFNNRVLNEIANSNEIKKVVLGGYWGLMQEEECLNGLRDLVYRLGEKFELYFILDTPKFNNFSPSIFRRFFALNGLFFYERLDYGFDENQSNLQNMLIEFCRNNHIKVLNPSSYIFDSDKSKFKPYDEYNWLYYDHHHLNIYGSKKSSNVFLDVFE